MLCTLAPQGVETLTVCDCDNSRTGLISPSILQATVGSIGRPQPQEHLHLFRPSAPLLHKSNPTRPYTCMSLSAMSLIFPIPLCLALIHDRGLNPQSRSWRQSCWSSRTTGFSLHSPRVAGLRASVAGSRSRNRSSSARMRHSQQWRTHSR